jgi:hypothetical protein
LFSDRQEGTKAWRTFPKEELHILNFSSDAAMVINSRRMKLSKNVANGEDEKCINNFTRNT